MDVIEDVTDLDEAKLYQEYSTIKIQSIVRLFIARSKLIHKIGETTEKIYDPKRKHYYYYDKKKNKSTWKKPRLLYNSDLKASPTYTEDEASTKIQTRVRMKQSLKKVRKLYQNSIIFQTDETSGYTFYTNPKYGNAMWELPKFMDGRLNHADKVKKKRKDGKSGQGSRSNLKRGREKGKEEEMTVANSSIADSSMIEEEEASSESDKSNSSSDSELSEDSEVVRARRRAARKFPRSQVQGILDKGEDDINNTFLLDLSHIGAKRFSSRLYDLYHLQKLDLSFNKLTKLSTNIQFLNKLQHLDLGHNRITQIPGEIEHLSELRELSICFNKLQSLPGRLYKLGKLKFLDLSNNELKEITVEVGNLELLQELGQWEIGIGLLTNLVELKVKCNKLEKWPEQLQLLEKLTRFDFSNNLIDVVPPVLGQNKSLEFLNGSFNKIKVIPFEFYELPLKTALLNNNQLKDLPRCPTGSVERYSMKYLNELNLSNNQLQNIDERLGIFHRLLTLNLSKNEINSINGSALGKLTSLKHFDLSHNHLENIPFELGNCMNLTHLDISFNKLIEMPKGLIRTNRLLTLNLGNNKITEINGKIVTLMAGLERFLMEKNEIVLIPNLLFTCKKLQVMDLSGNKISFIDESISQLSKLSILKLSQNKILKIPDTLTSIKTIQELELKENLLSSLPVGLTNLKQLKRITLSKNDLKISSASILTLLPTLISCNLSWNLRLKGNYFDINTLNEEFNPKEDFPSIRYLMKKIENTTEQFNNFLMKMNKIDVVSVYKTEFDEEHEKDEMLDFLHEMEGENDSGQGLSLKKDSKVNEKKQKKLAKKAFKKQQLIDQNFDFLEKLKNHFRDKIFNFVKDKKNLLPSNEQNEFKLEENSSDKGELRDIVDFTTKPELLSSSDAALERQKNQCSLFFKTLFRTATLDKGFSFNLENFIFSTSPVNQNGAYPNEFREFLQNFELGWDLQTFLEDFLSIAKETDVLNALSEIRFLLENSARIEKQKHKEMVLEQALVEAEELKKKQENDEINGLNAEDTVGFGEEEENKGISDLISTKSSFTPLSTKFTKSSKKPSKKSFLPASTKSNSLKLLTNISSKLKIEQKSRRLMADLTFGEEIPELMSGFKKSDLKMDLNSLPFLVHNRRALSETDSWLPIKVDTNIDGNSGITESQEKENEVLPVLLECCLGIVKVCIKKSDLFRDTIRQIEIRSNQKFSKLDIAQRTNVSDFSDLFPDVIEKMQENSVHYEMMQRKPKLGTQKTEKLSSFKDQLISENDEENVAEADKKTQEDDKTINNETTTGKSGKPPDKIPPTFSEILQILDNSWKEIKDPLPKEPSEKSITFLYNQRQLILLWALSCLEVVDSILKGHGWNLKSPYFRKHYREVISIRGGTGGPDGWLRDALGAFLQLSAQVYQALRIYSLAAEAHMGYLWYCRGNKVRKVYVELVKVYIAQGNYLLAQRVLHDTIRKMVLKSPSIEEKIPPPFQLLQTDPEIAVLLQCILTNIEQLEGVELFSKENKRVFSVQDNGLLSAPHFQAPEKILGRTLDDVKRKVELDRANVKLEAEMEQHSSRRALRKRIAEAKEMALSVLKIE